MSVIRLSLICQFFLTTSSIRHIASLELLNDNKTLEIEARIIGGMPTNIKKHPYMVFIRGRNDPHAHCGGTNLRPKWVLTAAHCLVRGEFGPWSLESPWNFFVVAGSTTLSSTHTWQVRSVRRVVPHPYYNPKTMSHDIGLLELAKPFRINRYVQYVNLPSAFNPYLFSSSRNCSTLGWGQYSTSHGELHYSKILRVVSLDIISNKECNMYYNLGRIVPDQFCAGRHEGGVDSCQGDSGGPLMCDGVQVGIVSWGLGCGQPLSPGVYTRVDLFLHWFERKTGKKGSGLPPVVPNLPLLIVLSVFILF